MSEDDFRKTLVTPESSGLSRRRYLAALGLLAGPAMAGCQGTPDDGNTDSDSNDAQSDDSNDNQNTADSTDEVKKGGSLVSTLESSVKNLDPAISGLLVSHTVTGRVIENLFTVNQNLEFTEQLATGVEISDDGKTWDISLREGVTFHPPYKREMTADDVVKNFDRMSSDSTLWHKSFDVVNDYSAVDKYTVRLDLSGPTSSMRGRFGFRAGVISPPEVFEDGDPDLKTHPVGTGPFKFEEWQTRQHIKLSAFDDYWRDDLPHVDEVTFRPISEASVKITELQTGNVDIIRSTPKDFVSKLKNSDSITVEKKKGGTIRHLQLNPSPKPAENRGPELPTTNKKIRHAIAEAIDREAMVEIIEAGFGTATQTWFPEISPWDIDADYSTMGADPEAAKQLIDEAGFERPVEIHILSSPDDGALRQMGRITRDNLKNAGFDPNLRELEIGTWIDEMFAWEWDINVNYTNYWPDPDLSRNQFHEDYGGWQPIDGHTKDFAKESDVHKKINELYGKGNEVTAQDERFEIYKELQNVIYDYLPVVPLYHPTWVHSYRNEVKNYSVHPFKTEYDVEKVWLDR